MSYFIHLLILIGIYSILAVSLNLIVGYTRQLSIATAAFFAVGAYTTAILTTIFDWTFWLTLPIVIINSLVIGIVVGVPTLKMRLPIYIAITTLGLNEIIRITIINLDITGGSMGLPGIPRPELFGIVFRETLFLLLVIVFLIIQLVIYNRILNSKIGYAFRAIREDQIGAESMGINATKYKLMAFAIGSSFSGIAGWLYAHYMSYIDPSVFHYRFSINILLMVTLGGIGYNIGSIIGVIILVSLPEVFRMASEVRDMLYGAALVILMIYMPTGVVDKLRELTSSYLPNNVLKFKK